MEHIVRRYIEAEGEEARSIYMNEIAKTNQYREFHKEFVKQMKALKKNYYYYLITFTLNKNINPDQYDQIEKFIISQALRPALKIVEAHYAREYTKKGIAHWHMAIKSTKFIAKNRFNYYIKNYGNIDISKSTNKSLEESINYINKEQQSIQIIPRVTVDLTK